MQFVIMAVGVLAILLAVLAQWLGIDKNAIWGTSRILLLISGVALLGFAILLHFWKTGYISAEMRHRMTNAGQKIRNVLARFIQRLTAWQPLAWVVAILVILLISGYAIWYTTLGRITVFSPVTNDYVDLGEAFLHGQLSLLKKPDPRLVALPSPYDSKQRDPSFNTDLSYYKGKFYLYWGPVPGLIYALTEWIAPSRPPDQLVALLSYSGLALILLGLLYQVRKRYYPNAPGISIPFFMAATLVNVPYLFILGRTQDYETSIIAGQLFLNLGVLACFLYQTKAKKFWLVLAGLSWGLAIASRYNLAVSVAVFSIAVLLSSYQKQQNMNARIQPGKNNLLYYLRRFDWNAIAALFIPLAICGLALAIYNDARFGNPLETGFAYQLTLYGSLNHYYSIAYIPSNLFVYLAYPLKTIGSFPFFKSVPIQYHLLPNWASVPSGKEFDQVFFGIFQSLPVIWPLALLVPQTVSGLAKGRAGKTFEDKSDQPQSARRFIAMLLLASLLQFIFLLCYFYSAMRYIPDFLIPLLLGIYLLIWEFDKQIRHNPLLRWLFWLVIIGLCIATVAIGFFAGFDIPPQYIRTENPQLFSSLTTFWNHPYNQMIILLGKPAALAATFVRISARLVGKFVR
ncbi:MAG TPA: hypothetical protein VKF38_12985 [Anaerolineaceae bacterium]|nr:hypothetical protein [Anaerolineaceae bacterium]